MQYSVFNWSTRAYDVFEGPGEALGQRPIPRRVVNDPHGPGRQPEALLPILPRTAQQVGTSKSPVGRIAIHHQSPAVGLGADPQTTPLQNPWVQVGLALGALALSSAILMAVAKEF